MRRTPALQHLFGTLAVALPDVALANSFEGLGVYVAGMFVGIPAAIVLVLILLVGALVRWRWPGRFRGLGCGFALLAPVAALAFPVAALTLEQPFSSESALWTAVLSAPAALLAVMTVLLSLSIWRASPPE